MTAPLTLNGIKVGFYPDEGDAGGRRTRLSEINHVLGSWGVQCSFLGWYAQT